MKIPSIKRFAFKARVAYAERAAKLVLGRAARNGKVKINFADFRESEVVGIDDPFVRERFLQMVLAIVGRA